MRADLEFSHPITSFQAEEYLLNHLCRLLHLYSGAHTTLCGVWDPQERTGRLLELGRNLYSERRRLVANSVVPGPLLREVAPGWDALSAAPQRQGSFSERPRPPCVPGPRYGTLTVDGRVP